MAHVDVLKHQLMTVSEGFCPEHLALLSPDDGWCAICETWWTVNAATLTVTQSFPWKECNCGCRD